MRHRELEALEMRVRKIGFANIVRTLQGVRFAAFPW